MANAAGTPKRATPIATAGSSKSKKTLVENQAIPATVATDIAAQMRTMRAIGALEL
jgi:hypothetical protein